METLYLIIVVVLLLLAVSDLVIGVSNDAVNFLNSAIGSRVAPTYVIMTIASAGVLIGATFSSGLMEVARKGIFHPEQFVFAEIMIIFLAVMITDVMLLDLFNTFGLPTSTTVSIVFELLGASVAMSVIKISMSPLETLHDIGKYINSEKALAIITGILLSVVIAFIVGAVVMYFSRLLFTFRYEKKLKYFGSIWGSIAITAITFFMLIKGAKGASFITEEMNVWIQNNTLTIIIYSLVGWTIILQLLYWFFKISSPKIIVLIGTFALAMAFAGNDLVNFIGVPLAGLKSYQVFMASPGASPDNFLMGALAAPVNTPTYILLLAGVVMILALWFSKKARSVLATTIDLSRQGHGDERFGASGLSRSVVRGALNINKSISTIIPAPILTRLEKRLEYPKDLKKKAKAKDAPSFDVIRASMNLLVASILIAMGTSLKLPLSTTYVTFMVAMGTSLSDRAWSRDSAVYRIQGMFSVIGGWFLTAIIAFTVAFIVANIIFWGGVAAIFIMLLLAAFLIYRTHVMHKSKETEKLEEEKEDMHIQEIRNMSSVYAECQYQTTHALTKVPLFFETLVNGINKEDRLMLKELKKDVKKFNKKTKKAKDNIDETLRNLQLDQIDTGHYYVQSVDYQREIAHCINYMVNPAFEHIRNNHTGFNEKQAEEMLQLSKGITKMYHDIIKSIDSGNYAGFDNILLQQQKLLDLINQIRINQVKRIRTDDKHPRTSLLFLDVLAETKNMLLYSINLLKSQRDFINEINNKK
ncbi:MAG: inorganic phosphate transporter [Bacteroidales bacterium]|jgi:phosphate/sulfate permease|nr:inorganic phosphate transporter [Bacteroidales bacterium]MDD4177540.1 inorganic phosphate transporter [Bacteroidales bacterium]MDD4742497.1 inorganic phosphate transporter [Bacteroidales bacterium]MDY0334515.1 inorganic phosphate transporter [Bacteroidales bacterium]NCU35019.1 phosphate permease [Candidatus Falkowbacteria bacterium]